MRSSFSSANSKLMTLSDFADLRTFIFSTSSPIVGPTLCVLCPSGGNFLVLIPLNSCH